MPAEVAYGFDAETLVVWLDGFHAAQGARSGVLCRRHADAMVVPLGWMLDDRRELVPRLFKSPVESSPKVHRRRTRDERVVDVVQLSLHTDDVTGELTVSPESLAAALALDDLPSPRPAEEPVAGLPWQPHFDQSDDLSGLLKARGRLLSRAFNGFGDD